MFPFKSMVKSKRENVQADSITSSVQRVGALACGTYLKMLAGSYLWFTDVVCFSDVLLKKPVIRTWNTKIKTHQHRRKIIIAAYIYIM